MLDPKLLVVFLLFAAFVVGMLCGAVSYERHIQQQRPPDTLLRESYTQLAAEYTRYQMLHEPEWAILHDGQSLTPEQQREFVKHGRLPPSQ
jgi:uncharacterized membrane protein